jgi:flagellar export protein FliJ
MKHQFALQTVLDARHSKVESLEIGLARLLGLQIECQTILTNLTSDRSKLIGKLSDAQLGTLDLFEISNLRGNLQTLDKNIVMVTEEMNKLTTAVNAKRQELVFAKQAEESLDIIRRKRLEIFKQEQDKVEASNQDDLYIARAFRQLRQED